MPKYLYRCAECGAESVFFHSMDERVYDCKSCDHKDTLIKIPAKFNLANKKNKETSAQAGSLVKTSIEDFKEDLKEQKRKLANQDYGNKD